MKLGGPGQRLRMPCVTSTSHSSSEHPRYHGRDVVDPPPESARSISVRHPVSGSTPYGGFLQSASRSRAVRPSVHAAGRRRARGMKSTAGSMSRAPIALDSTLYSPACSAFSLASHAATPALRQRSIGSIAEVYLHEMVDSAISDMNDVGARPDDHGERERRCRSAAILEPERLGGARVHVRPPYARGREVLTWSPP